MNIKKVNVLTGIIFSKLYFIYPVFKNVFRKSGNILTELLKKIVVHESLKLICPSISKKQKHVPHIVKYNLDRIRKCSGNVENNKRTKVDFMVCSAMFCKKILKKYLIQFI